MTDATPPAQEEPPVQEDEAPPTEGDDATMESTPEVVEVQTPEVVEVQTVHSGEFSTDTLEPNQGPVPDAPASTPAPDEEMQVEPTEAQPAAAAGATPVAQPPRPAPVVQAVPSSRADNEDSEAANVLRARLAERRRNEDGIMGRYIQSEIVKIARLHGEEVAEQIKLLFALEESRVMDQDPPPHARINAFGRIRNAILGLQGPAGSNPQSGSSPHQSGSLSSSDAIEDTTNEPNERPTASQAESQTIWNQQNMLRATNAAKAPPTNTPIEQITTETSMQVVDIVQTHARVTQTSDLFMLRSSRTGEVEDLLDRPLIN